MFNTKKRFFKDKIDAVTKTIWEVEFKIAKARQVREGIRGDRDRAVEASQNITKALEKETEEARKENLQKQLTDMQENVSRYQRQMKMIDEQINGAAGDETHEPVIGLLEQIQSYTELRLMYQDYISKF